jgi:hypothetical protein
MHTKYTKCCIYSASWWSASKYSKHVEVTNRNQPKAYTASCWSYYAHMHSQQNIQQLGSHHCTNWLSQRTQLILRCITWLTLSNITSISEYFIPWTRIGTSLVRCGDNASLQIGWSANDSQNSQASKATPSSGSWVRINMYWSKYIQSQMVWW